VEGKFNSIIRSPRVNFLKETENALLTVSEPGGCGMLENPMTNPDFIQDKQYEEYLVGRVLAKKL